MLGQLRDLRKKRKQVVKSIPSIPGPGSESSSSAENPPIPRTPPQPRQRARPSRLAVFSPSPMINLDKLDGVPTLSARAQLRRETSPPPVDDVMLKDISSGKVYPDPMSVGRAQLQKDIVRQMEYYFGDYNLPKDRYMKSIMEEGN